MLLSKNTVWAHYLEMWKHRYQDSNTSLAAMDLSRLLRLCCWAMHVQHHHRWVPPIHPRWSLMMAIHGNPFTQKPLSMVVSLMFIIPLATGSLRYMPSRGKRLMHVAKHQGWNVEWKHLQHPQIKILANPLTHHRPCCTWGACWRFLRFPQNHYLW